MGPTPTGPRVAALGGLACATLLAGTSVLAAGPAAGQASGANLDFVAPSPVAGASAAAWAPDSRHPDPSTRQHPARLVGSVGADEVTYVSAFEVSSGGARVVTDRVRGSKEAAAAVRAFQRGTHSTSLAVADRVSVATDDTDYDQQWAMPRLDLPVAWSTSDGSGVTVAVIDTGVDTTHPDLAANLLPGHNVVGTEVSDDVTDGFGHGTHVSGIVAAVTGNALGVAGVAPGARILPVKALGDNGTGWTSDIAEAVVWAVDHGARVINLSLASSSDNSVLADSIAYARSQGVIVVAAAGNGRQRGNATTYPAAFPGVLAVAATDVSDVDAAFSSTGSFVDVAAPGVGIHSTVLGGNYGQMSGTSMAAPHVAGVAALLLAELDAEGPIDSTDPVTDLIVRTAEDLGPAGWDPATGYGLVDPVAALAAVTNGLPPARPGPPPDPVADPGTGTGTGADPITPSPSPTRAPSAPDADPTGPPGAVRGLRVRLGRPPVLVRWRPPAPRSDGKAVTHYLVRTGQVPTGRVPAGKVATGQVFTGKVAHPTRWRAWHRVTAPRVHTDVGIGRWRVQVVAVNSDGKSAARTRSFTLTRQMVRLPR